MKSWLFENPKTEDPYLSSSSINYNTATSSNPFSSHNMKPNFTISDPENLNFKRSSAGSNVEVVTVDLSFHETGNPLGMRLAPAFLSSSAQGGPENSTVVIIAAWERLPISNKLGPIQRSGKVRLGDRLVRINELDITHMSFRNVMDLLKDLLSLHNKNRKEADGSNDDGEKESSVKLKTLGFVPLTLNQQQIHKNEQHSSRNIEGIGSYFSGDNYMNSIIALRDENINFCFSSTIRSWRMNNPNDSSTDETHDNESIPMEQDYNHRVEQPLSSSSSSSNYIEYEIECQLISRCKKNSLSRVGNRNSSKMWKVWRRYSEFKLLDKQIRESHGWQINSIHDGWGVKFPPPYNITSVILRSKFNPIFIEMRRNELKSYWDSLQRVQDLFNFVDPSSHRYSGNLAKFLNIEQHMQRGNRYSSSTGNVLNDDSTTLSSSHTPRIFPNRNLAHKNYDNFSTTSSLGHPTSTCHDDYSSSDNRFHNAENVIFTSPASYRKKKKRISGASKSAHERSLQR